MDYFKALKSAVHQVLLLASWRVARLTVSKLDAASRPQRGVLLMHCDPWHLVGSLGDEAMMTAAQAVSAEKVPGRDFLINAASPMADEVARARGFTTIAHHKGVLMPFKFLRTLRACRPEFGLLMGADVMDGHYSPVLSLWQIIHADLMARSGVKTAFLGFSLNRSPAVAIVRAFRWLHPDVAINIRDAKSLRRFTEATGVQAHLVADTAFLLTPSPLSGPAQAAVDWAREQRQAGRRVVAINFHPLLYQGAQASSQTAALGAALGSAMQALEQQHQVSWLYFPHDNRDRVGDVLPLTTLYHSLSADARAHSYLMTDTPRATEAKAICSELDAVITGRMHLAIAALGMGVPVQVFDYQDKFKGLMEHFQLSEALVLDPEHSTQAAYLTAQIDSFLGAIATLRTQVAARLPQVMALAERNYQRMA